MKPPPPSYLELVLTDNCNLRCSYCWQQGKAVHDMAEATALAAIDFLVGASGPARNLTVLFFGGEPMLRFDLIERLVAYGNERAGAREKAIAWTMTTNGTLLSEAKARRLAELRVKYLLSIDGGARQHDLCRKYADGRGTFADLAAKLPMLKRYQPWQGTKMSIAPEGAAELAEGVECLSRLGVNQFIAGHVHGVPWSEEQLAAYERSLLELAEIYLEKRRHKVPFRMTLFEEDEPGKCVRRDYWGCGAGRGRLCVDSRGDLYGCSKLATIHGAGRGVLPLGTVWAGVTSLENLRRLVDPSPAVRPKCAACALRGACTGGCPAINAAETGDVYRPGDVSCRFTAITERVHAAMKRRFAEVFPDASAPAPAA